jgi:hypothetical protein
MLAVQIANCKSALAGLCWRRPDNYRDVIGAKSTQHGLQIRASREEPY